MNKEKLLIKNTAILAIGQLSSKILVFLLLPLYTSLLSPEDFGTIDMLQTFINLTLYFATLQIESAIFRFIIESRRDEKEQYYYIINGLLILIFMSSVITILTIVINQIIVIPYVILFILAIWAQSLYLFISNLARGLGKNIDYSIANFIVTIVALIINIIFIIIFEIGASSIIIALIFSNIIGFLYLLKKLSFLQLIKINKINKRKMYKMLCYSLPLIPNAISWWIVNTSDRLLVMYFLGTAFNGIYAVANKIPTIYTTIFTIFNTAWAESVALSINDSDCNEYINLVINKSLKIFSFLNMGIIILIGIFFKWIISKQYSEAYNHIFILLIAIFINSICSLLGGILSGLKNTKVIGWTTVLGAIINIVINFIFIKFIGLYAVSISTLVSYLIVCLFRFKEVKSKVTITISKRYIFQLLILIIITAMGYFYQKVILNIMILCILIIWGSYQNKEIILLGVNIIKLKINKKN